MVMYWQPVHVQRNENEHKHEMFFSLENAELERKIITSKLIYIRRHDLMFGMGMTSHSLHV